MSTDDGPELPVERVRHPGPAPREVLPPRPEKDPGLGGISSWPLAAVLGGAGLIGAGAVLVGYWAIGTWVTLDTTAGLTPAQRITAAFGIATALGALVALVVNLRKQDLAEQTSKRELDAVFTDRFASAAAQLGGDSPAERIAGVYATAALADEYPSRRQQCVDVLCGYLRLPFDPATDHLSDRSSSTVTVDEDGRHVTTHENPATRPHDRLVRETITTLIRDHTQSESRPSWSGLNYNLAGAHLTNLNLSGSHFRGTVDFRGATFSGDRTSFHEATFSGQRTYFDRATFSAERSSFAETIFSGELTSFARATFSGQHASFARATFSGKHASFARATFSGQRISFGGATFSGEGISFAGATFSGELISFDGATFSGKLISFAEATFSGKLISFAEATFSAERTSFLEATFSAEQTSFHEATFSGERTSFRSATFSGKRASFDRATFSGRQTLFGGTTPSGNRVKFPPKLPPSIFRGVEVHFDGATHSPGTIVSGLAEATLEEGATVTMNGQPFSGWEG